MTPDSEARCDLAPDLLDAVLLDDRTGDETIFGNLEITGDLRPALHELVVGKLVALGEKDAFVDTRRNGPVMHLTILRTGSSPHVEQDKDQPESIGALEIAAYELAPGTGYVLRDLGIAVTGEVDDVKAVVDEIELNGLRLPGCLADARHCFPFQNGVDEARFSDVGATDHRELRSAVSRKVVGFVRRAVELDCSDVQVMSLPGKCKCRGAAKRYSCSFGELTREIVPVFSGSGQGMVTKSMAGWMEHPCQWGWGVGCGEWERRAGGAGFSLPHPTPYSPHPELNESASLTRRPHPAVF